MTATDPWGNAVTYDPERDGPAQRLAALTDAELVELFGLPSEGWETLIPEENRNSPTLGAVRRAQGVSAWCDEAKVDFAVAVVLEAQRRILIERFDSIMEFLAVGATPDKAVARVDRLVAEYRGAA